MQDLSPMAETRVYNPLEVTVQLSPTTDIRLSEFGYQGKDALGCLR
jgi:hypothetical protein